MSVSATNTNPYYIEYINSSSDVAGIRKMNESKSYNEEKTYLKYSTQDQRNIKVSEKLDEKKTLQDYNILLQQNTPAAKLLGIIKTFNETKKNYKTNTEEDYADFTEINKSTEEKYNHPSSDEIGFYVVIDDRNSSKELKRINGPMDIWRRRINNTYHLGFMKEPGTLVNVVV